MAKEADSAVAASVRVARYLRDAILSGELPPGSRIRQEELAAKLGASRLPVREALRMLEAEGLTQLEVNKGARVPALDLEQMQVIYQMRERLEPLALALSVDRLDPGQRHQLAAIQDEIEETGDDIIRFLDLDRRFHLLSYDGCPSAELLGSVTRLWNSTQHYRRALMLIGGSERHWLVNAEHRLIIDAIARRDVPDCERFLAGHLRRTRIELEKHPELFAPAERAPGGSP
ncbi:GntR family transcriptional regulator [Mycobacterium tuberculosis]|nr:GntR family transcriptional regulator [Mycobacterium tuberculosis]